MQSFAEAEYSDGVYQEYIRARELKYVTFRARLALIQRYVSSGRLLDVGCACGYLVDAALQAGYDAYGIEFSAAAINQASPEARQRILLGNIDQLKVETLGQFDVITAFDIIEHSLVPLQFLSQLRTLLRPGGCLVLTTPDTRHILRFLMGERWPMLQPLQHTFLFSRQSLRLAVEQVGLQLASVRRATKCLTMDYLAGQIEDHNPSLHRVYRILSPLIPQVMRRHPFQVNIGEMLAVAIKPE
jgi:SAM-dependent methyltransferase